ncbi:MAG: GNAT family N-acetyltransferase [Sphingorhabdus sp.]
MLGQLLMEVLIRPERDEDHAAIYDITKRAFAPMPYAGGDEQDLIDKLRETGALALSLVAEKDGAVVGQVTFSPAFAADGSPGWYALGPVSVEPALKHQGIGRQLIHAGIAWLQEQEAAGCVLVGNPAYYSRFGFQRFPNLAPQAEHAEYFQILPLGVAEPDVVVGFHAVFHG